MEDWELDFKWLRVQHIVQSTLSKDKLPDLNAILFLIGIQELGQMRRDFTKEEKQDLMHVAVCKLFSLEGYYEFAGRDEDGWPHYRHVRKIPEMKLEDQEKQLKSYVVEYFRIMELENGGFTN